MHPLHNPIVEVIQHATTPATSTLLIFLTHKFNHLKKMKLYTSSKLYKRKYENMMEQSKIETNHSTEQKDTKEAK
jgi:hypothetical protein